MVYIVHFVEQFYIIAPYEKFNLCVFNDNTPVKAKTLSVKNKTLLIEKHWAVSWPYTENEELLQV